MSLADATTYQIKFVVFAKGGNSVTKAIALEVKCPLEVFSLPPDMKLIQFAPPGRDSKAPFFQLIEFINAFPSACPTGSYLVL